MRLDELCDWSDMIKLQTDGGILKGARASQLGLFIILDIECSGSRHVKLLELGSDRIGKLLPVLRANIGRPLSEISRLEIDV